MTWAAARDPQAGLTLVEMLVALVLFGLVGLASFAMLDTVIRVRDRTEGRLETVDAIDRALLLFSRDLGQSLGADRSLADGQLGFRAAIAGGSAAMRYHLADGVLLRSLDRDDGGAPLDQRVLQGVAAANWQVLDEARVWHDVWPPPQIGPDSTLIAVQMHLTLASPAADPLTVSRLVEIPQQAAP